MGMVLREMSSPWHSLKLNCRGAVPKGKGAFSWQAEGGASEQHSLCFFGMWGKGGSNRDTSASELHAFWPA